MKLIDTHCHLHDAAAFPDPEAEVVAALAAGVEKIIVVGVNPEDWPAAVAMAERFDPVFAIVGWHPNYTADYRPESMTELARLLAHPKVLAMGEIGLDYHWDHSSRDQQYRALVDGLDLAASLEMPVVFHAREAYGDLLDVLEARPPRPYLFHCFVGTAEDGARAAKLGSFFGVDGPISYRKSDELRQVIRSLPKERLVVETDSPYMAPVPFRGKPNRPAYVAEVTRGLSDTLEMDFEECAALTTANARRFFGNRL